MPEKVNEDHRHENHSGHVKYLGNHGKAKQTFHFNI